jgi:thymidylate kinase
MGKLTVIAGLPGAGKTTFFGSEHYDVIYDDFYATQPNDEASSGIDANKFPLQNSRFSSIVTDLYAKKSVAVADIVFCIAEYRNRFLAAVLLAIPSVEIEFVFFENNLDASLHNIQQRGRAERLEKELMFAKEISQRYSEITVRKEKTYDTSRA